MDRADLPLDPWWMDGWEAEARRGFVVFFAPTRSFVQSVRWGEALARPFAGSNQIWIVQKPSPEVRQLSADYLGNRPDILDVQPLSRVPSPRDVLEHHNQKVFGGLLERLGMIEEGPADLRQDRRLLLGFDAVSFSGFQTPTGESEQALVAYAKANSPADEADFIAEILDLRRIFDGYSIEVACLQTELRTWEKKRLGEARNGRRLEHLTQWREAGAPATPLDEVVRETSPILRSALQGFGSGQDGTMDSLFVAFFRFADSALRYTPRPTYYNCEPDSALFFLFPEYALCAHHFAPGGDRPFWLDFYEMFIELFEVYASRYSLGMARTYISYDRSLPKADPLNDPKESLKVFHEASRLRGGQLESLLERHGECLANALRDEPA